MSLKHINANIKETERLIEDYTVTRDSLKLKPVKHFHAYICGTIGSMLGISMMTIPKLDILIFSSIGGFVAGYALPYVVRNVNIGFYDYNIYVNKSIIKDLNKKKDKKMFQKVKSLSN